MPDQKWELTPRQKTLRGIIFIAAGIFLILQMIAPVDQNPSPLVVFISWGAAFVAFGSMLAFIWDLRRPRQ
jgi:uncharacterized membrane protein